MHNEQYNFNLINRIWGCFAILLMIIFFARPQYAVYAENLNSGQQTHESDNNYTTLDKQQSISFENKWVEVGVPLKVKDAPENSTFDWAITAADGTKRSFTTIENYYTPKETDKEKLISVTITGNDSLTTSIYFSSLPVVYIQNDSGYYGVNDEYTVATMSMQGDNEIVSNKFLYSGDIKISLRGSSTKNQDKRPFNISMDKKSNLLGMGENKYWALLANDIDHTLMRNKLDRKSTRLNSSHSDRSRMPSSA